MTNANLAAPVELTDAEIDAVAGGAQPVGIAAGGARAIAGLIAAGVGAGVAIVANLENNLNRNDVAVNVLSGGVISQ